MNLLWSSTIWGTKNYATNIVIINKSFTNKSRRLRGSKVIGGKTEKLQIVQPYRRTS
jgi:hypothetical protein